MSGEVGGGALRGGPEVRGRDRRLGTRRVPSGASGELAELAARRDEASNAALDCGMEIRRVEAEIARIEGGGG